MTFAQFHLHLWESGYGITTMSLGAPIEQVVIRSDTLDHDVAAVHREGSVLVIDLGHGIGVNDESV